MDKKKEETKAQNKKRGGVKKVGHEQAPLDLFTIFHMKYVFVLMAKYYTMNMLWFIYALVMDGNGRTHLMCFSTQPCET